MAAPVRLSIPQADEAFRKSLELACDLHKADLFNTGKREYPSYCIPADNLHREVLSPYSSGGASIRSPAAMCADGVVSVQRQHSPRRLWS